MTVLDTTPPAPPPPGVPHAPPPPGVPPAAPPPGVPHAGPPRYRPERPALVMAGQMLAILGAVLLCFVAQLTLLGGLKHERDQNSAYNAFRTDLAKATAPVTALDGGGRLLDSGTPVAIIEIPRLRLQEVVLEGTSARTLKSGPGHVRNTPLPGQSGTSQILGRKASYGGPFAEIDKLRQGDEIVITTGQGEHRYLVQGVRRANDKERTAPAGEGRLTLATADGSYFLPTDIIRVDARLVSEVQAKTRQLPAFAVADNERAMVGDRSALVPIALWTLILAAAAVAAVYIRQRVGRWQAWVIGVPVVGAVSLTLADQAAALLPNLM
ncbi:sortase [Actinokineospora cianjurensis]|uniref:LPXTG-site transpeptidase (Sortase) family protein n=1 Tax=Actinokineospora cianjurensis TaxID=585224 RepID=A0A421AWI7_9PSEU|nr:class E sortase [Actinokineospora cianjurensis]RLK54092.1 LPXTG-site transpeptidase (sortase) family protein [Actinokineospora cianjurensis]